MQQDNPSPLVLIQVISVTWTKRSRGAPGATSRQRIPEVLALPPALPDPAGPARQCRGGWYQPPKVYPYSPAGDRAPDIFYHHTSYTEANRFQPSVGHTWLALPSLFPEPTTLQLYAEVPPLTLVGRREELRVEMHWQSIPGMPRRHPLRRPAGGALAPGQWLQIRFNARNQTYDGDWYYTKHVLNVGFAVESIPTFFLAGPPEHRDSDLADLR
jgi:hypothetical protein